MLHQTLWQANRGLAAACLAHPFVRALGDGSLDADLFRGYIAQDAFFLRAFVKAYALALARSEDVDALNAFQELIGGVLEELEMHRGYALEMGVDLGQVSPSLACRAYTDFLLHTAWHSSLAEIVAAMTPCLRLYAFLGGELAPGCGERHPYRRWIAAYSGIEFQQLAARLETLLDRFGADTPAVRDSYQYAMQCELDFFSDAMQLRI